ncbi:hypothetical protein DICPUDRAFT_26531 [Dictyostelium purpureum]|uniref:Uncharacterized protein n=1 Tax=Dictyostelium purpureum TaxID=5786 RepID=F0Z8T9_DICPU|nr:uncharacterized protein DICPUDRAFT_26531 [Dictyostelium purpureum]EGC39632.1 hypothetical protein DICPUDRAFT_26531 [Dictyostelium purpureum]|eukprot:XP_003283853.1 hypothetical protein DICPUDRAFT_26531 [Dictyostelium purpureum]
MKVYINNKIYFKSDHPQIIIENNINLSNFIITSLKEKENKIILKDGNLKSIYSYDLIDAVQKVAKGFNLQEINKRDVVGIITPNILEYTYCVLGVILGGGIVSQINPNSTVSEIKNTLSTVEPKFIIINYSNYIRIKENIKDLFPKCRALILIYDCDNDQNIKLSTESSFNIIHINSFMDNDGIYNESLAGVESDNDIAAILFSGGTTGNYKGVCLTHSNCVASIKQVIVSEYSKHTEPQKIISCIPMYHMFGFITIFLCCIAYGCCLYFFNNYNLKKLLTLIEKEKITFAFIIPTIGIDLAKSLLVEKHDCSSLKSIISGGAPFPETIVKDLQMRIGVSINKDNKPIKNLKVRQVYGLTESSAVALTNPFKYETSSSGNLVSNMISKVIDFDSGVNLDVNKIGHICLKGPNIMKEYYNNKNATNSTFDDEGFLLTGDIGYFDENGELYIVDRIKDLIKSYGYQVTPAEIESILLSHPKVQEACVIGVPSVENGEAPKAFIVLKPNEKATKNEIYKWLNPKISHYKSLNGGIVFIDSLPKSPAGKILRRNLKLLSKM